MVRVDVVAAKVVYRWGLVVFWRPSWLKMNRGLPFLLRGHHERLGLELTSSRCGALSLLHRDAFKKPAKLVADLPPLRSGWHWHRPEEYCCLSNILASPSKD
jgi:hypothetical protein